MHQAPRWIEDPLTKDEYRVIADGLIGHPFLPESVARHESVDSHGT
jgi:hypothetical protein